MVRLIFQLFRKSFLVAAAKRGECKFIPETETGTPLWLAQAVRLLRFGQSQHGCGDNRFARLC